MARSLTAKLAQSVDIAAAMTGVLFLVFGVECFYPALADWGIRPRTGPGLVGILFSPLLHASAAHLLVNAPALFILLVLLFWDRHYQPWTTLSSIWVASGVGTWVIGRGGAVHIGASSIIYGLAAYIIASGLVMRSWRGLAIGLLVFLVYGGIFYGVLPHPGPVSWEGHLCGAIAGVWAAKQNHV